MSFVDEWELTALFQEELTPFPQHPCGEDLRLSARFDWLGLREARRGDEPGHLCPAGARAHEPNWNQVETLCRTALQRYSKDLQIAIWATEALSVKKGMEGIYEGLFLIAEMIRLFWRAGLFPHVEHDEAPALVELLEWFDGQLAIWLKLVPLSPVVGKERYSITEFRAMHSKVAALNKYGWDGRYRSRWEQDQLFEVERTLRSVPASVYQAIIGDIDAIRKQVARVNVCLRDVGESVSFSKTAIALRECQSMVVKWSTLEEQPTDAEELKDPVIDPQTIADPWKRALAWIRLGRFERAIGLIENGLLAAATERDRFLLKFELAAVLYEVRNYAVAITLLEYMSEQIDQHHLQVWEGPTFAPRIWKLLHDCYRKSSTNITKVADLEAKLFRMAPWQALPLDGDSK